MKKTGNWDVRHDRDTKEGEGKAEIGHTAP